MSDFGPYPATIQRVVDGDSLFMTVDVGFSLQITLSCRIYGINAPELRDDAGKAARDFAKTLVSHGDCVTVVSHGWDKYGGRFDGTVTLPDGRDFAAVMLEAGHAKPWDGNGPKPV